MLRPLLPLLAVVLVVAGAVWGMERLKDRVYRSAAIQPLGSVELVDPPDWVHQEQWGPRILGAIAVHQLAGLPDEQVVQRAAEQMAASGWVERVRWVHRGMDGVLRIACEYRRPIAMIQTPLGYVPVDREGTRLPEVYEDVDSRSGWLRIIGVRGEPPPVGQRFACDDALAGVRLSALIFDAGWEIASRISAVDVNNFRGRVDRRKDHILLWRPDHTAPIVWGSAIGEEIEEPSPSVKLATIVALLRRGEPQAAADVSVLPGAAIIPVPPAIQTADSTTPRGR